MAKVAANQTPKSFSGNSKRAWLSSSIILSFAIAMFILDLASNGWTFEFGLNLIEIMIFILVILRWNTSIIIDSETIQVKQLQNTVIPLASISHLTISYTPVMGYVAALNWQAKGQRRSKRLSFFASFYKKDEPKTFLKTLYKAMPQDTLIEVSDKAKHYLDL